MPDVLQLVNQNCRDCHKCIRFCPVKAIRFTGHRANIIGSQCILCGQCFSVCPHNAKRVIDDRETLKVIIQQSEGPVFASLDPTAIAFFGGKSFTALEKALKELGFSNVEDTSIGAALVRKEYEKMIHEGSHDVIISSQCQTITALIEKYYPALCEHLAPVVSPMIAHTEDIKKRYPNASVVYFGPCISKKYEAYGTSLDLACTFEELRNAFKDNNIIVEDIPDASPKYKDRQFVIPNGIINNMNFEDTDYIPMELDGIHLCKTALEDISKGNLSKCFIEMSSCRDSCLGGPIMRKFKFEPIRHYQHLKKAFGKDEIATEEFPEGALIRVFQNRAPRLSFPMKNELTDILKSMGKNSPEDEINCGSCGYNTCREKAVAVYQGIADPSMCLPYNMERTRRFQSNILDNTPNGVLILNEDFEIQVINNKAMEMFNIRHESDILGEDVVRVLDPGPFFRVFGSGKKISNEKKFFSEYNKYLEQTIVYDKSAHTILCILRDVTESEEERIRKEELGRATVETADKVVDKQMRIVQEIASLLGETAAETKAALTKLKESIDVEEVE